MKEPISSFSLIAYLLNLIELNKVKAQQIISTSFLEIVVHKSHVYI